MICPEPGCNCGFMHPIQVRTNAGGEVTTTSWKGTEIARDALEGRGVSIKAFFQCERGHVSVLALHFHKGSTEAAYRSLGELGAPTPDGPRSVAPVIWRD